MRCVLLSWSGSGGVQYDGGIDQFVSQLPITGGDEKKVGYYAGIIVS